MGVTVAVTRVAANTSTGTQDITTTDLGGLTPKAALLIASRGVSDGTAVDGAGMYFGISDGTTSANLGYEDEHGQATSDAQSDTDTTSPPILIIYNGAADSTIDGSADFSSWITNGIRINWTDAPSSGWLIMAVLFAGSDLSAKVLSPTSMGDVTDNATDITSIGFEADIFIGFIPWSANNGIALGLVHNNRSGTVTQRSVNYASRTGQATMQMLSVLRADAGIAEYGGNLSLDWYGEFSSFDSSGFTVTTRNNGGNNRNLTGIALRLGSSPVISSKVYTYSTPTSTGSNTDSNPGFEPQFVLYLATRAAVAGTTETDADGGSLGIVAVDADDLYTQSVSGEDAAADSNTQSLSDDRINLPTHTGGAGHEATFTSFGSSGVTWSYGSTDATARLWAALAFGINSGGSATVTLSTLTLAGSVPSLTVQKGAVSVVLDTLDLVSTIPASDPTPGGVSVTLDTLALAGSAEALSVQSGGASVVLDTLDLTASVEALDVVPGAKTVTLSTLTLASAVQALSVIVVSTQTVILQTLTLVSTLVSLSRVGQALAGGLHRFAVIWNKWKRK